MTAGLGTNSRAPADFDDNVLSDPYERLHRTGRTSRTGRSSSAARRHRAAPSGRTRIFAIQIALTFATLAAWEYLPRIEGLRARIQMMDPFFISSPSRVATTVVDLASGRQGSVVVWAYLWRTLEAAVLGLGIGMLLGALLGLIFSNSPTTARTFLPFVNAINATPRIAFVPIVVVVFGAARSASVTIAVLVVFFVSLFNAIEGGRSVPTQVLQNAQLLGASPLRIMVHVRLRYVVAWCLAALPVALAFSLVSVVTAEVFTGYPGVGRLLMTATATVNADLTFALVAYLAVLGVLLVGAAERVKRRLLHWWN